MDPRLYGDGYSFTLTRLLLLGPGGHRSVVAESLLARHQLLILNKMLLPGTGSYRICRGVFFMHLI